MLRPHYKFLLSPYLDVIVVASSDPSSLRAIVRSMLMSGARLAGCTVGFQSLVLRATTYPGGSNQFGCFTRETYEWAQNILSIREAVST